MNKRYKVCSVSQPAFQTESFDDFLEATNFADMLIEYMNDFNFQKVMVSLYDTRLEKVVWSYNLDKTAEAK